MVFSLVKTLISETGGMHNKTRFPECSKFVIVITHILKKYVWAADEKQKLGSKYMHDSCVCITH